MRTVVSILFLCEIGCEPVSEDTAPIEITIAQDEEVGNPILSLSQSSLSFYVQLGGIASSSALIVTNIGNESVHGAVAITGDDADLFTVITPFEFDLPPGDFEVIELEFNPSSDDLFDNERDEYGYVNVRAFLNLDAGGNGGTIPLYGSVWDPTWFSYDYPVDCGVIASISPTTPDGVWTPGFNEVLRFDLIVPSGCGTIQLTEFDFQMFASDNAYSEWNQCATSDGEETLISDVDNWDVVINDASLQTIETIDNWAFFTPIGVPCDADADGINDPLNLQYVTNTLTLMDIDPGEYTVMVFNDTTGASSVEDDTFRLQLDWLAYQDQIGNWWYAWSTPVNGKTIEY